MLEKLCIKTIDSNSNKNVNSCQISQLWNSLQLQLIFSVLDKFCTVGYSIIALSISPKQPILHHLKWCFSRPNRIPGKLYIIVCPTDKYETTVSSCTPARILYIIPNMRNCMVHILIQSAKPNVAWLVDLPYAYSNHIILYL